MSKDIIKCIETDNLSKYNTFHKVENYGEITSIDDYKEYLKWSKQNNKKIYILGNGSNTLFVKKNVESLVLKNKIPKEIKCSSEEGKLFEVTTTMMMYDVLTFCYNNSLDSFYYLASVPATIGGALAMNAGEGKHVNKSIYDFVISVTYIDTDGTVKQISREEMNIDFRKTMFTGCQDKFIISAIFKFPYNKDLSNYNPIKERIKWAKTVQDNVAPNCGSVFNQSNDYIMRFLKGLKIGKARYSSKTTNWINNKSKSSRPILILIYLTEILHLLIARKSKVEVIRVK
jgi:UDP-N-acetylmuramate dehydrogenase